MSTAPARTVRIGDQIRTPDDPLWREVLGHDLLPGGWVQIEIAVGSLIERIGPMMDDAQIEITRR